MKLRFTVFGYELVVVSLEFDEHVKRPVSLSERISRLPKSWLRRII